MTVKQLYKIFDARIPSSLSCDWDNDGLMLCPLPDKQVKRVLLALAATAEVADAAIEGDFDVIITHHPMIFNGLKAINDDDFLARKVIKLIQSGVAVFSFHTRLDAVEGGVNDVLARELGLENVQVFGADGIGRIGDLYDDQSLEDFARNVKEWLDAPYVNVSNAGLPCKRIAVVGGGGGDEIGDAMKAGADTFVTGELRYHNLTDAPEVGINLIEAGHFYTEDPVLDVLAKTVCDADSSIVCDIMYSNRIKAIV